MVMTVVAILSGGILAGVYRVAQPLVERQAEKELKEAIFSVLPQATSYDEMKKGDLIIYQGLDDQGNLEGIAFVASGSGYQGKVRVMVGMNQELTYLQGMKVLESVETPGLGGKITSQWFQDQFKGLAAKPKIEYVKGRKIEKPNEIQAITGATISTRAIVEMINQKATRVKETLGVVTK